MVHVLRQVSQSVKMGHVLRQVSQNVKWSMFWGKCTASKWSMFWDKCTASKWSIFWDMFTKCQNGPCSSTSAQCQNGPCSETSLQSIKMIHVLRQVSQSIKMVHVLRSWSNLNCHSGHTFSESLNMLNVNTLPGAVKNWAMDFLPQMLIYNRNYVECNVRNCLQRFTSYIGLKINCHLVPRAVTIEKLCSIGGQEAGFICSYIHCIKLRP